MNSRLARLNADYIRISQLLENNPFIHINSMRGNPPVQYVIKYRIKGIDQQGNDIIVKDEHLVEINLPRGYPKEEPHCRMLTSIFHPNIAPHVICVTDHWTAAESLVDLVVRIGQMICFQSYNTKSPRNGEAAKWAEQNINRFPIDNIELSLAKRPEEIIIHRKEVVPLQPPIEARIREEKLLVDVVCQNCGFRGPITHFHECAKGHIVCPNCTIECQICGKNLCVLCSCYKYADGEKVLCLSCYEAQSLYNPPAERIELNQKNLNQRIVVHSEGGEPLISHIEKTKTVEDIKEIVCQNCGFRGPITHFHECAKGHIVCPNCTIECQVCGKNLCVLCSCYKCSVGHEVLCADCCIECSICKKTICNEHFNKCDECQAGVCFHCLSTCSICGKKFCKNHINELTDSNRIFCDVCSANCYICGSKKIYPKIDLRKCEKCGRLVCSNHFDNKEGCCKKCIHAEEDKIRISYEDLNLS